MHELPTTRWRFLEHTYELNGAFTVINAIGGILPEPSYFHGPVWNNQRISEWHWPEPLAKGIEQCGLCKWLIPAARTIQKETRKWGHQSMQNRES